MVDDITAEWARLETNTKKHTQNIVDQTTSDYEKLATAVGISNEKMATSTVTTMQSIEEQFAGTLVDALSDGKLELRDFEGFFRSTLTNILTEALTKGSGINNALSGKFSGTGGGGGFFSGGLSGIFGKVVNGIGGFFSGLGFANGGRPPVGQASLVGERGPEMFVPDTAGTIVPNHALGGQTVVFNLNSIDTQTGTQFLLDNKQQIIGMVQQAGHRRGKEIF